MVKKCHKCKKNLSINKFTKGHNKSDKTIEYIRNICYECHYGWNIFWKNASEEEKFKRMCELFEKRVIKKKDCWDFLGRANSSGYFEIKLGGRSSFMKSEKAHRVSWMIYNGPIPDGLHVLHKCDNRRCTNPKHLFLGTNYDNAQDREKKGRGNQLKEEHHNKAVLTKIDVKKIKNLLLLGVQATKIARDFGVGSSTIYNIKYGNTWRNVF